MNDVACEKVSFWCSVWPDEQVIAETLVAIVAQTKTAEVEALTRGQWQRMPAELGRLRAVFRASKGAPSAFAVRAPGLELRLSHALGTAAAWETAGTLATRSTAEALGVLDSLGAVAGTFERTDGSAAAFRRRAMDLPALPGTGEPRGPWLWLEPLATTELAAWNASLAQVLHGVVAGEVSASRASARASKACHKAAAVPPALPSFMLQASAAAERPDALLTPANAKPVWQETRAPSDAAAATEQLDLAKVHAALAHGPVPFAGSTTPQRIAEVKQAASASDDTDAALPSTDETALLPAIDVIAKIAPLPFSSREPAAPAHHPAHRTAHLDALGASTEPIDLEHLRYLRAKGPTPFAGATTPERLAELKQEAAATAAARPSEDLPDEEETAMLVPSASLREHLQTLPFQPAAKAVTPDLTVEQYASMTAQLTARRSAPEVLASFGITTPQQYQAVLAEQTRRFEAEPALRARYDELREHYLSFMQDPRR